VNIIHLTTVTKLLSRMVEFKCQKVPSKIIENIEFVWMNLSIIWRVRRLHFPNCFTPHFLFR